MDKRKEVSDGEKEEKMLVKRIKGGSEIIPKGQDKQNALVEMLPRTSGLKAPIMQLTGHQVNDKNILL